MSQKEFGATPTYEMVDEQGPDHSKCFKVSAMIGVRSFAAAWGPSKKEAEQRAAQNAMAELDGQPAPHVAE
jgi:ribonuclease-3